MSLGKPVQIRRGPRHCKRGGPKQQRATGIHLLGRQLRSDETRARRPIKSTSMRVDLGREVDDDSRNPSKVASARSSSDDARDVSPSVDVEFVAISTPVLSPDARKETKQCEVVSAIRRKALPLARCSGSAVKIRHCPATVSDAFAIAYATAPKRGGKAQSPWQHVASQETGPPSSERKLTVRSFQGKGGRRCFPRGLST